MTRRIYCVAGMLFFVSFLFWSTECVAKETPSQAPLNPLFELYMGRWASEGLASVDPGTGYLPPPVTPEIHSRFDQFGANVTDLRFDLRDPDGDGDPSDSPLTAARNQGACGSCWAFAAYGGLESHLLQTLGLTTDFSENNLIHRHGFDSGPCSGGNLYMAAAYLARSDGPVLESEDPYDDSPFAPYCEDCAAARYVDGIRMLPVRSSVYDNAYIKQALLDHGALTTAFYYHPFYYHSVDFSYFYSGQNMPNHGVLIVGWDDERVVPGAPGPGAFIMRNSWGEGGYFYISYYDTTVAFEELGYFWDSPDSGLSFDRVYQYDPLGWVMSLGYSQSSVWAANRFLPTGGGVLKAVGFYATAANLSYEIRVYDRFDGSSMGNLLAQQSGSARDRGWYVVPLDAPALYRTGDELVIVVEFINQGYNYSIAVESAISGYSSAATAEPGQSYISYDGLKWLDLTSYAASANVCIKAFVADAAGACTGDSDGDGDVDGSDLVAFALGKTGAGLEQLASEFGGNACL
jgi:C1A family cysteine protease